MNQKALSLVAGLISPKTEHSLAHLPKIIKARFEQIKLSPRKLIVLSKQSSKILVNRIKYQVPKSIKHPTPGGIQRSRSQFIRRRIN